MLLLSWMLVLSSFLSAQADEPVVIHLTRACFNLPSPDQAQVQKVEDAINARLKERINVEIRLTDVGSDNYYQYVRESLNRGEINLLWTASWESDINPNVLVAQGEVYDITDLLPGTALYASMSESQWEDTRFQDRNYFIPIYKDNVEGYDFMFRRDLADAHGWDVFSVHKLEDLEPMLEDAKNDGLKYPFLTQNTAMFYRWYIDRFDFFTADASTNFFAVDRKTNQVINTLQTPEYASFCKLMGRWMEKGYLSEDDMNRVTKDTTTKTKDWAVSWWTDVPVNAEASSRYGQPVVVQSATERYEHSSSSLGSCYCITKNSTPEQVKAAIDFLGLLFTDRALADIYTFGIEGEDFEYTRTDQQSMRHITQHSDKYNHSMWESASAMIVTPLADEPDNKSDLYIDFNCGANVSAASGFRFNPTPVMKEFLACRDLFDSYGFILENGGIPEAQVDACIAEYQKALNEAGYQIVLEECQRQYEAWKAE